MSSNLNVKRICSHCNDEFVAKTTVTKYCGDICAKRAYKARKRNEKIEASEIQTLKIKAAPILELQMRDFLTVPEVSKLIRCSTRTTYRLIEKGVIKGVNLAERKILVRRIDLEQIFE